MHNQPQTDTFTHKHGQTNTDITIHIPSNTHTQHAKAIRWPLNLDQGQTRKGSMDIVLDSIRLNENPTQEPNLQPLYRFRELVKDHQYSAANTEHAQSALRN